LKVSFTKDEILFREGEASTSVYRLLSGEAAVSRANLAGGELMGTTRPGEFIGEMGALVGAVRSATVTFTADSEVEQLTRDEFLRLIAADGDLGMRLLHALSLRTRAMVERLNELGSVEAAPFNKPGFFSRLVHGVAELLRRRAKFIPNDFRKGGAKALQMMQEFPEIHLRKGEPLFEEGAPSQYAYFVKKGVLRVMKGGRPIGELRHGAFIGEMGILESRPRSASAVAARDAVVAVIPEEEFYQLMRESRSAYFQVVDALCERAQRLAKVIRAKQATNGTGLYEAVSSMESVAQLAEHRLVNDLKKARRFFTTQATHGREMMQIYERYLRGEASKEELERANAHFRDYIKIAGLGTLLVLPGAVLSIPLAAKIGKALGVDIFPKNDEP
jgi:CRP-like cAMP-binding protein